MYGELYRFLLLHKKLSLTGIGTFTLDRIPGQLDFPNRQIDPPAYAISFQSAAQSPSRSFLNWLAHAFQIGEREAIIRFNEFVFGMKQQLSEGSIIHWDGVGTLSKGLSGECKFVPATKDRALEKPVRADKVIRTKATHTVKVGEDERTSVEMIRMLTRILNQPERKRSFWWIATVAMLLFAIIFAIASFSRHGSVVSSAGNNQKPGVQQPPPAYRQLR